MTNKFTITVETDLDLANLRSRLSERMLMDFLKIWTIKYHDYSSLEEWEKQGK